MDAVFKTPEMVEAILLQTDLKTLLLAQRVCHSWHNLITQSPSIQKHLFFQPDFEAKTRRINPLLSEYFAPWFPEPGDKSKVIFDGSSLRSLPLIRPDRSEAFRHEKASWRRMLPRQPPVDALLCFRKVSWMGGTSISSAYISTEKWRNAYDREGEGPLIRMEALYEEVVVGTGNVSQWGFFWHDAGRRDRDPALDSIASRMDRESQQLLDLALEEHGLIMFRSVVVQCSGGRGPWFLGSDFWLKNGQTVELEDYD